MRTLKKALSLVLVLAMVFALAVPGFAANTTKKASDFKDYSKVTNKEAVDVLTAIGVINGNADGTFAPEGNFTRAEAATLITYLTLGKTVADALPTGATKFTDVPATHWAAKYVQYCAQEGIVAGVGNGKFDPDAKLTATQWALMLLGALGYNAKNEGIGGTGWEIATTKLAMKAGVASAEDLSGTFNRDMAAKMALNTLTANMVEYKTTGTNITIGDTTISTGASTATPVEGSTTDGSNYDGKTGDGKMQFCEQHFKTLKLGSTTDDFGRTANVWKLGTTTVATYAKAADLTYTTTVKGSTLYKDLGLTKTFNGTVNYAVNGGSASVTSYDGVAKTSAWTIGGNGTVTEVYKTVDTNGDLTALNIVEIQTFIGQVTAVTKATSTTERTVTVAGRTFTTNEFAVDDYVLYTLGNSKIQSMKAAPVAATGKVTAVNSTTGKESFVVDGKTYEYSATNSTKSATLGATATLYLDNYGYVILNTGAQTTTNYAVVVALGTKADSYYGGTDVAKLVLSDGSVVDAEYKVAAGSTLDSTTLSNSNTEGVIVSYTITNDVYTLTPVTVSAKVANVTTNKAALTQSNGTSIEAYADSKTVFIVRSGDSAKNYTYKAYTGIAAVPSMTGVTATTAYVGSPAMAKVVYITAGTDAGTTSSKAVFVTSVGAQIQEEFAADGTTKLQYVLQNAVVDGKVTTIKVKGNTATPTGLYATVNIDSNGLAVVGAAASSTPISNAVVYYTNGILKIGSDFKGFNADAVCYIVDKTTGAIAEGSIAGLSDTTETLSLIHI